METNDESSLSQMVKQQPLAHQWMRCGERGKQKKSRSKSRRYEKKLGVGWSNSLLPLEDISSARLVSRFGFVSFLLVVLLGSATTTTLAVIVHVLLLVDPAKS